MRTKRVEDLTTAEITEIRFAAAALQKRRETLENEKKLHEATIQWTRNPGVKRTLTQRNQEIDQEILKTMRKLSDAR